MADEDKAISIIIISAPVVMTGTRVEQNSFDLPMSIDSMDAESIKDGS